MSKEKSEYDRNYYLTHSEQIKERVRKFNLEHPEYSKNYRLTHKGQNKSYFLTHPEKYPEYSKKFRLTHPEYQKNYARKNLLGTSKLNNGKPLKCNKRSYPLDNACELCGKMGKQLAYHHWDNNYPELGIWLCTKPCHWLAESLDYTEFESLKIKYMNFKEIITKTLKVEVKG